jgi:BirA family biotin operon repressor/biotin-[acetyl-CoA-carboxylase] ligase
MTDDLPETDLAAATRRVEHHARIGSTNDRARALLREPDGAGTLVVADEQLAGRGRRGRSWASPAGRNLYCSLPVRPRLAAADAWWLSAAAALAVQDACAGTADLLVKWPNDLVTADGSKVAGLLLETSIDGDRVADAVIGIGINVNWLRSEMPGDLAARATSLAELSGAPVDRGLLLERLATALERELAGLEGGQSPLARYRAAAWLDGREVEIETGGERITGVVRGISDDGSLRVESANGPIDIGHGEVVRVHRVQAVPA